MGRCFDFGRRALWLMAFFREEKWNRMNSLGVLLIRYSCKEVGCCSVSANSAELE